MTLSEFKEKPLVEKEDAVSVIGVTNFDTIKAYLGEGSDHRLTKLLWGLWEERERFTEHQILEAILEVLFGASTDIRWQAGTTALMFAQKAKCEQTLMREIQVKWPSLGEQQTGTFLAAFSGFNGAEDWLPRLSYLFDLNTSPDVRARIINTVHNLFKIKASPENRRLLKELLDRMSDTESAYSRPGNFQLMSRLKCLAPSFD